MFIEIHMLQNFGPSNLNRGDTGAPKDCTFGGYRRARISSQCIKRSVRKHPAFTAAVTAADQDNEGIRTKRLVKELITLLGQKGHEADKALAVAEAVIKGVGLAFDKKRTQDDINGQAFSKTQYLLYLSQSEIAGLAELADKHWETLSALEAPEEDEKADKKKRKQAGKKALPAEVQKELAGVLRKHPRLAADIALFGRMMADDKDMNVDAACQVAHALSTNEVNMEMDFYTAVDDLLPSEESGSDMMGIVEFNSACYYRYAQVNPGILHRNLQDKTLGIAAVKGFLEAMVQAIPTGMQNSMAAHNPPCYVRVFVRSQGAPWSLSNAFVQPVRPEKKTGEDLTARSAAELETHLEQLQTFYGSEGFDLDAKMDINAPKCEDNLSLAELLGKVESHLQSHWPE